MIVEKNLRTLLISDLYSDIYNLDNLKLKLEDENFNFVFISGDIIDLLGEDVTNS